jgi:hypothetical protein
MNVPLCSSVMACRNSSWGFMTIGPYHGTGSSRKNHHDARVGVPGVKEILAQRVFHVPCSTKKSAENIRHNIFTSQEPMLPPCNAI